MRKCDDGSETPLFHSAAIAYVKEVTPSKDAKTYRVIADVSLTCSDHAFIRLEVQGRHPVGLIAQRAVACSVAVGTT